MYAACYKCLLADTLGVIRQKGWELATCTTTWPLRGHKKTATAFSFVYKP